MATTELLRPKTLATYLDMSRRSIYLLDERDPTFPRKIVITARCVGWRKSDIDAWLKQRAAE